MVATTKTLIKERDIQGVPSVYLNGELFANGKVDTAQLIDKLIQRAPPAALSSSDQPSLPLQDVDHYWRRSRRCQCSDLQCP